MSGKRGPGRPRKPEGEKARRILITLSPEALDLLDAMGKPRATSIERLIRAAAAD